MLKKCYFAVLICQQSAVFVQHAFAAVFVQHAFALDPQRLPICPFNTEQGRRGSKIGARAGLTGKRLFIQISPRRTWQMFMVKCIT